MLEVQLQQQNAMRNAAARTTPWATPEKTHSEDWELMHGGLQKVQEEINTARCSGFKIESHQQHAWDTQVAIAVYTLAARW